MGYGYGFDGRLACDGCGVTGGVRKRKCPHTVLGNNGRSYDGKRHSLPYCQAPALCNDCYRQHGGLRGVHTDERCGVPARASQARDDAIQARLDAGESLVTSAIGGRDQPEGLVKVWTHDDREFFVDQDEYRDRDAFSGNFIADLPSAVEIQQQKEDA